MAADPERGHFFTDRLLHARGMNETMLLGADTIRPVLNRLLPDIDVVARPRFSKLSYVGPKKATRLPRRSAVVGFSANEIYDHRRADPPPARRHGDRHGRDEPAHAQRPGRDVPVGRGRVSRGDRRHRHGPQHGREPCLVRVLAQVRRPRPASVAQRRAGADRRPRRTPHERRHVRHDGRRRRPGAGRGRGDREPPLRSAARCRSGATAISISARCRR